MMPVYRMRNATFTTSNGLRFIKSCQQKCQKCHVIAQSHLPDSSMTLLQTSAQTTVACFVGLIFPDLQFRFVYNNISEHRRLASLLKLKVTFRAAYHNLSFSFWNPDLLLTFWASVNMMILSLLPELFLLIQPITESCSQLQIFLIFRISCAVIF